MTSFALLARARVLGYLHAWRGATPRHRLVGLCMLFGSGLLFIGLTVGGSVLIDAVRAGAGERAMASFVERMLGGLATFLLAGSLPFVAGAFFSAGDLPLSSTLPLSPRVLALLRLLDACASASAQFVVLGLPLAIAGFLAVRPSSLAWIFSPLWIVCLLAIPPLAAAVLLLAMARRFGIRRVRLGVAAVSIVLAIGACYFAISETASLTGARDWRAELTSSSKQFDRGGTMVRVLSGREGSAPLIGVGFLAISSLGGLTLLGATMGGQILVGEALLEGNGLAPKSGSRALSAVVSLVPTTQAIRAILVKDLRYVARDLTLLSQLGVPVILYLVPYILAPQARRSAEGTIELLGLSTFAVAFIAYMVCSILGLSSVGLEGHGYGILRASPLTTGKILLAKWWLAFLPSSLLALALGAVAGMSFDAPSNVWFAAPGVILLGCAALCGIEVGIAGLFPRFEFENPAHRASIAALIWGFVFASAYAVLALGSLVVAAYGAIQAPDRVALALMLGGGGAFVVLSVLAAVLPLRLAAMRLDRYSES